MASPALQGDIDSPHPYHLIACGGATIAAAGAPTLTRTGNGIFKSITRTGVGTYDVAMTEAWKAVDAGFGPLSIKPFAMQGTFALADGSIVTLSAEQVSNVTTPKFTIKCQRPDTMALADLASGAYLGWDFQHQFVVP